MSPQDVASSGQQQQQHGLGERLDSTASEGGRPFNNKAEANGGMDSRHGSTASECGRSFRRGISIKEKSHQDIADHFMYQVPSSLNSTADQEEFYQNASAATSFSVEEGEIYKNTGCVTSQPAADSFAGDQNELNISATLKGTTLN